jgi:NAD(P)H-nitrite reductase large subunit
MSNKEYDNTIICRCEDITRGELHMWIDQGLTTVDELKRLTRATMGPCQGRTCRQLILQEIASRTGVPVSEAKIPTYRQPLRGITLGAIADMKLDEEGKPHEE